MRLLDRIREVISGQGAKSRTRRSNRHREDEDEDEIEELIALDII